MCVCVCVCACGHAPISSENGFFLVGCLGFLFCRCNPERYYFGLIYLTRNALVTLLPVVLSSFIPILYLRTDRQTVGRMHGRTNGRTDRQTDGRTVNRTDTWTDKWTDRQIDGLSGGNRGSTIRPIKASKPLKV